MPLIKSHTDTITLDNVEYIRSSDHIRENDGTCFYMSNGKCVTITCPYDVVIHQLAGSVTNSDYVVKVVHLEY